MTTKRPRFCLGLFLLVGVIGLTEALARASVVDDLDALKTMLEERAAWTKARANASPSEVLRGKSDFSDRVRKAALKAYEAHPGDPRRWEAAMIALQHGCLAVADIKPGYDEAIAAHDTDKAEALVVYDTPARIAWDRRLDEVQAALFAAADVPPRLREDSYMIAVDRISRKRELTLAARWDALHTVLQEMERKVKSVSLLTLAYDSATRCLEESNSAAFVEYLQQLAQSPKPEVAGWAKGKLNLHAAKTVPMEFKFTALDGRKVDLAALRGKVVLIDFWATWCGPCKRELPNLLEAYRKYHEQGFEVIGISLDIARDRRKFADCVSEYNLPWPQCFDGKGSRGELAARFSIRSIPAMLLLDKTGRLVSTDARGGTLHKEVRRLLGIDRK